MTALIPLVVTLPLLGAAIALILGRHRRAQIMVTIATLSAVLVISSILLALVMNSDTGGSAVYVGGWEPPWGIVLVVDPLAALMLVVTSITLLGVLLFSVGQGVIDGNRETPVTIFHPTYLILSAGILNAFVAGDLFNLYVGFEILLAASYVLITLGGTAPRIRAGTIYVVVSLVSSMFFLSAIGLLYGATGTVNMAQLSIRLAELPTDVQLVLHVVLLLGFGIKAAVFPLSFWLPDSYPTAPAPVTAVFAGLLTKVGVYALIRTETLLFPGNTLHGVLLIVALLTLVVGILGAVAQADIKRMLSFTLVSHIGYLVFGIALGTPAGYAATIFYVIHHITVQTTLFLTTGLIERVGGTTSILRLGGLLKASPLLALLYFLPAMNLGGIPPFTGFLGKVGLFRAGTELATEQSSWLIWAVIAAGAATSLLTLYAVARVWNLAFWRRQDEVPGYESPLIDQLQEDPDDTGHIRTRHSPPLMVFATAGMVVVGLALTVGAGPLYDASVHAAKAIVAPATYIATVYRDSSFTEEGPR
ncbi:Na+/H+ antiporter subunit D [Rathayibacter toxicus]|uniref:Monovalent cation/H+ antiporter subunit D n=1 Tax=Rathayibacter toxicus TaxID=145458 RepID=A0A0C5BU13_9MICO|nr:Na+/H+ antiporter subunit D [Rathayibacter toxicus]AJM78147.1 monovalent cation/H+ antiporter subunit D [Rathayibacter toxicus]ALS57588.1 cation:proton antiporter [Rathayibacter toxicus]KKM44944.1 monovalent cation/H+ antiporter subunit D [Rathayibacter toxicus]PPG20743.1 Na+/H+ antiporter subunit D [Rathayibacter toxicus]PPG45846.1 Na+/H+ antiporter subunit D [Rathayibacter toxicus]